MHQFARADERAELLDGKDVLVGVIDVATDMSRRPRKSPRPSTGAAKYVPPKKSSPAPIAAWRRHLYLPDAPPNPPSGPGQLPDLRNDPGAGHCDGGRGPNHELADMTRRFWVGLV
jgi:hypothetical protein